MSKNFLKRYSGNQKSFRSKLPPATVQSILLPTLLNYRADLQIYCIVFLPLFRKFDAARKPRRAFTVVFTPQSQSIFWKSERIRPRIFKLKFLVCRAFLEKFSDLFSSFRYC